MQLHRRNISSLPQTSEPLDCGWLSLQTRKGTDGGIEFGLGSRLLTHGLRISILHSPLFHPHPRLSTRGPRISTDHRRGT